MALPYTYKSKRNFWLLALSLMLLSFGLRIYHLDSQNLSGDEALQYVLASRSLEGIFQALRTPQEVHPPLFYILHHLWLRVAGDSEFSLRYLPLIFGMLS